MKKLLYSLTIMIFSVAYLMGCKQDPNSSTNGVMTMSTSTSTTAHPAWTFPSSTIIKKKTYYTVAVSDSDGSNNTNVYTSSVELAQIKTGMTWSASGGSISFIEAGVIKAVDVAVTNGVPKGSNARTIYTPASGTTISYQTWCPASTNAKIAFVGKTSSGYGIYTVSTSGGTASQIYTAASGDIIGSLTWSNDGTQLAFAYKTGTTLEIKVIDASTGTENSTLISGSGYLNISQVVWSHSGSNTLAFSATKVSGGSVANYYLYTVAPTSGSTETQVVNGYNGYWSPDNSELVYSDDSNPPAVTKKVTVSTGGISTVGTGTPYGDWKQP